MEFYQREAYHRPEVRVVVKDSEVIKVGDVVVIEGGVVANVDLTTEKLFGLCTGFVDSVGVELDALGAKSLTGSGAGFVNSTKTFTAGSDNTTTDVVEAKIIAFEYNDKLKTTLDADKGTTTSPNSGNPLTMFSILTTDSSLLDESTASVTEGTIKQFLSVEPDADGLDSDEVIVKPVAGFIQYHA